MTEIADHNEGLMTSESFNNETEAISAVSLGGIENSLFQLTVEKLDGKNYREWARSIKLIIKIEYLNGETRCRPTLLFFKDGDRRTQR